MIETTTNLNNRRLSTRTHAITTGLSLLVMTIAAIFSYGYVLTSLVSKSDNLQTVSNIQSSSVLFFLGVAGWIIIIATDTIVSFSLYGYFSQAEETLSKIAAGIRIAYTFILSVGVYFLYQAGRSIVNSPALETGSTTSNLSSLTRGISSFESIWSFGLIIFGLHLVVLAFTSLKSKGFPKLISYLLLIAGISYTSIHFMHSFLPSLDSYTSLMEGILSVPMTLAELSLAIWMLVKGGKIKI